MSSAGDSYTVPEHVVEQLRDLVSVIDRSVRGFDNTPGLLQRTALLEERQQRVEDAVAAVSTKLDKLPEQLQSSIKDLGREFAVRLDEEANTGRFEKIATRIVKEQISEQKAKDEAAALAKYALPGTWGAFQKNSTTIVTAIITALIMMVINMFLNGQP